jgi:hypothetical protein
VKYGRRDTTLGRTAPGKAAYASIGGFRKQGILDRDDSNALGRVRTARRFPDLGPTVRIGLSTKNLIMRRKVDRSIGQDRIQTLEDRFVDERIVGN